jgi:hypothetical protein
MTIRLRLADEEFDIPNVGDNNWGEQVTLYLKKNSDVIATIQGPQDILLTEAPLADGGSGPINGLAFDTSTIQQINVEGIIIRTFTTAADPTTDSFVCEGVYDGANFFINPKYMGTDAKVTLDINNAGQFIYTAESVADTDTLVIKFKASAIIEEA